MLATTTRLEYRHNNGYDSVLLVDEAAGFVRSDWVVTPDVMRDFCDCSQDASDWDDRGGDEHLPSDYGDLVCVREAYSLSPINPTKWAERVEFFRH